MLKFLAAILMIITSLVLTKPVYAVVDPTEVTNNRFGIHILTPTQEESSPAADLVNSNGGDWGYITIVINSNDRDIDKWQGFFNDLRQRHLIPIVRIATHAEGNSWKRPTTDDANAWADFLDQLRWPVKNRYVIVYNEPNHATEWGNSVDPVTYAQVLDQTIDTLKSKNQDFFVMNAGFDASTPEQRPNYADQAKYMQEMNQAVPGIFNKLDGWSSHSYPNPDFSGSPNSHGRGTVRTWIWELEQLRNLGVSKDLPVFITETGWKHAADNNRSKYPSPETVGQYLDNAFNNAWNDPRVVAVTPFLLNYTHAPFANFSFKKATVDPESKVLGEHTEYYPHYLAMLNLPKAAGTPKQDVLAELVSGQLPASLVTNQPIELYFRFKNIGQSTWNQSTPLELKVSDVSNLNISSQLMMADKVVEPGQEATFRVYLTPTNNGPVNLSFNLSNDNQPFDNPAWQTNSIAKAPVNLNIKANLAWKDDSSGNYLLDIASDFVRYAKNFVLDRNGEVVSGPTVLLPDDDYDFTISRPFYKPKTIHQTVTSGENTLDFGTLEPDIGSAILKPRELWNLLPFSD